MVWALGIVVLCMRVWLVSSSFVANQYWSQWVLILEPKATATELWFSGKMSLVSGDFGNFRPQVLQQVGDVEAKPWSCETTHRAKFPDVDSGLGRTSPHVRTGVNFQPQRTRPLTIGW